MNHASAAAWKGLTDISVDEFEQAWAVNGRGAFVCSSEAVSDMFDPGGGTIIFTGWQGGCHGVVRKSKISVMTRDEVSRTT